MQKAGTARIFCSQNKILIDLYAVMQKNGNWLLWFEKVPLYILPVTFQNADQFSKLFYNQTQK